MENDNSRFKKNAGFRFTYVVWMAVALQLVMAAVLGVKLIQMNMLPARYMIIYVVVVVIIAGLTVFATKKNVTSVIMLVVSLIVTVILVIATSMVSKLDSTIKNVTDNANEVVTEMVLVVLADEKIEKITDMSEYHIGFISGMDEDATEELKNQIKETAGSVTFAEFKDNISMVKSLYNKTISACILNKAYIPMICETEGYEDFESRIKILLTSEVKSYIEIVQEHESNTDTFIVYFSGIDTFGGVTARSRSDVNILAAVNTKTKHIQLVSTPRDYYIPHPNSKGVKDKLTHAGLYGVDCSIGALEKLYGINIDYYVRMNFSGFEQIIDALGGIDVYSENDFTVEPIKHYTVGVNHLSGIEALAFARERKALAEGDIGRGKNQMAVITAMVNKLSSSELLYNYTGVLDSISGSFQTNMSSEDIYTIVRGQLNDMSAWTIDSYTTNGIGTMGETYSMPGYMLSVKEPSESEVAYAAELMKGVLAETK